MIALTLQVDGRAFGGQAASQPQDFVRLQEMQAGFSGVAPLHHTHTSSDISDFSSTVLEILAVQGITGSTTILLQPNGGLASGVQGLYVDSGIVSFRGHKHQTSDIVDFQSALIVQLGGVIFDSASVFWSRLTSGVQAFVRVRPAGGILGDSNGLYVDLGTAHTQAAFGDHTHSQLHNPVTFEPSSSLAISLNVQDVTAEVRLGPQSGMIIGPSGVVLDFGTGHNQVMRGDASVAGVVALTVFSTSSLILLYDPVANVLSGSVRLDGNPSSNRGKVGVGSNGLWVQLGTDAQSAAAGNHIHAVATSGTDGFMSAADKRKLDGFGTLIIEGGDVDGSFFIHDSTFYDSGVGIFVNNKKVVGDRQTAPNLFTDSIGGTLSDLLAAIPNPQTITFGDASGVLKLVSDLTTNILPKLRNALSSLAKKENDMITAGKNSGYIG